MSMILNYLGTVAAVLLTVSFVPGVEIDQWTTALFVALLWSVLTIFVRPVLAILTLPVTVLTLGLFYFVLNALLFWFMSWIVPSFQVEGFWAALLGAIVLSVLNWLIQKVLP